MDRLRSFLNLERGEEAPALLLFAYLTLVMTSYMITKAVRDGLFLYKFSAYSLPYVYLGIAAIIGFVVWVYVRFSARVGQAAVISGSLVFLVGNLLVQWWAVRMQWLPATWIFYVWTSIFGIIIVTQVWTVANHVLDLRQAKRLFPLISSGGILGSALGGASPRGWRNCRPSARTTSWRPPLARCLPWRRATGSRRLQSPNTWTTCCRAK